MLEIELELVGTRRRWKFDKPEIRVGRDPTCDIVLPSEEFGMVSRQHVVLRVVDNEVWAEDQNTSNGTFINGQRSPRKRIAAGDLMRLGSDGPEFRVQILGGAEVEVTTRTKETRAAVTPETHRSDRDSDATGSQESSYARQPGASRASEKLTMESAMIEQKLNTLKTLVIVLLVLCVVLAGVSVALLQQIDRNQKTLQEMRAEARGAVQQFMPELDARLTKFERRMDQVEAEMNGIDAKIQAAEDRFIQRMERELPRIMDRIIEQKIQELSRRQPPR